MSSMNREWQGTLLAAGANTLATKGGAVLKGFFISAKGTSPTIRVDDAAASNATNTIVAQFIPTGVGFLDLGGIGLGTGLFIKVASCTATAIWAPRAGL